MRIPSPQTKRRPRIEIIPLIDIMFFLLATFIMVSLSMIQNSSIPVALPSSHTAQPDKVRTRAEITVAKEGKVFWNKSEIPLGSLPEKLRGLKAADEEAKVFIHGDKDANFGLIVSVLDAVRKAGIKQTAIRTTAEK